MTDADRVFARFLGQKPQAVTTDDHVVVRASGRNNPGTRETRVVQVAHLHKGKLSLNKPQQNPVPWSPHAETWEEGFSAKPASVPASQLAQMLQPEPEQPSVHVMPMWQPTARVEPEDLIPARRPRGRPRKIRPEMNLAASGVEAGVLQLKQEPAVEPAPAKTQSPGKTEAETDVVFSNSEIAAALLSQEPTGEPDLLVIRRPRGRPRKHFPAPAAATIPTQPNLPKTFADPFVTDDTGANCLRCGYLVEPARERLGLWTCASCG